MNLKHLLNASLVIALFFPQDASGAAVLGPKPKSQEDRFFATGVSVMSSDLSSLIQIAQVPVPPLPAKPRVIQQGVIVVPPRECPPLAMKVQALQQLKVRPEQGIFSVKLLPCPPIVGTLAQPTPLYQPAPVCVHTYAIPVIAPIQFCALPSIVKVQPPMPTPCEKEFLIRRMAKGFQERLPTGQRVVMVQAMCVQVPHGFCRQAGLDDGTTWVLTPRETKMFVALVHKDGQIISRPQLAMADGQPGRIEVGQLMPVVVGTEALQQDGQTVQVVTSQMRRVGVMLEVTPQVHEDGQAVLFQVRGEVSTAKTLPHETNIHPVAYVTDVHTHEFRATVELSPGWTAVLRTKASTEKTETLWLITAQAVVDGK